MFGLRILEGADGMTYFKRLITNFFINPSLPKEMVYRWFRIWSVDK